ncbi:MAG: hypothetical protein L3J11_09075 [Draconibacterium sp.]|nr:hypothetical protein [Draconibacterium sp.]
MVETKIFHQYSEQDKNQLHYAMLDGAMYLTRGDKWKEAKMGRIFKATDNVNISEKRGVVTKSQYVTHLGNHKEFLSKFEYYLDDLRSLAIIADGAKWIWNWAGTYYPDATQILDYYHALDHLCEFATNYFKDNNERTTWIEEQAETLIEEGADKIIDCLRGLPKSTNKKTEKERLKLIDYYTKNRKRMRYGSFRKRGLLIGSGAIESAHRTVLQQRMKLRACSKITSGFYEHLLHTYFVKTTHRNPAMLVFFAASVHKILSLNSRTYF